MLALNVDYFGKTGLNRDELRSLEDVRFVDRDEFCRLLVSRLRLKRCDIPSACIRGVLNPATGFRYLIEEERLFTCET